MHLGTADSSLLYDVRTMDQLLDEPLAQPRLSALVLAAFSIVALLLSAIGLYGVMSATVRQQTRDIGVRIALGASARDVYRLVFMASTSCVTNPFSAGTSRTLDEY